MVYGKVVCGKTNEFFGAISELRRSCWRLFYANVDFLNDEHDKHAMHFLVLADDTVIACARLCIHTHLRDSAEAHLIQASIPQNSQARTVALAD
jgi:hypothetical protein